MYTVFPPHLHDFTVFSFVSDCKSRPASAFSPFPPHPFTGCCTFCPPPFIRSVKSPLLLALFLFSGASLTPFIHLPKTAHPLCTNILHAQSSLTPHLCVFQPLWRPLPLLLLYHASVSAMLLLSPSIPSPKGCDWQAGRGHVEGSFWLEARGMKGIKPPGPGLTALGRGEKTCLVLCPVLSVHIKHVWSGVFDSVYSFSSTVQR